MRFVKTSEGVATKGSTLILPAVSIGNVPQLTVDLIINTLKLPRIGILDTSSLIPVSGPAGFGHLKDEKSVPLEVYQTPDRKWTIIQQRSPPLAKHHRAFAREMVDYIKEAQFGRVVLLASSDAALRTDELIDGPPIRTLSVNWDDDDLISRFRNLMSGDPDSGSKEEDEEKSVKDVLKRSLKQLHSAGITRPLLELCLEEGVPVATLVAMVNEGDNVQDALVLASAVHYSVLLETGALEWQQPKSWEWLMPNNAPSELF
ncbi:hypothetical protein GGI12_003545 [Dipsacomyces acuminosporus]|nr:hypothetical protein GGI12_003545 [Dipsacomyces acuminosporus]